MVAGARASHLSGYLPPTHLGWLDEEPDRRWRELDSSLLFTDVSGFTRLGERLARRGRIGSEQLTDAINAVFTAIVDTVDRSGGELIKFGGDAALILFSGAAHEQRACFAAGEIQNVLAELRVLPARGERLQASAGVASGAGHLFLAGEAPRDLIVAGPLASAVVSLEGAAGPGEILVSSRTAAALPPACLGAARGDGRLLDDVPPRAEPPAPSTSQLDADPLPGLPRHLHDHEPGYGEHRSVAVGFLQFRHSDSLMARRGADELWEALDAIVGATSEAARTWNVTFVSTDVDRDAGKLILCAGAPTASPDDDDRILHALRSVVERDLVLPVRAGVNRGPAFTVDIGPPRRRVWSVMGDAVNLAARVMAHAENGQLLATSPLLARAHDEFERTTLPPFKVKGKAAQVQADVIGPARGVVRAAPPTDAPLVGRREELSVLRDAVAAARAGGRRIVELVGDPGIGKSRLVEAVLLDADGLAIVRIEAGPYGAHSPYLALRRPLRALLGCSPDAGEAEVEERLRELVATHAASLEPWLPLLAIPLGLDVAATPETESLQPEFARQQLNAAFAQFLDLLLPEMPTLTVVEDAHWLDEASAGLLLHLLTADRATGPRHGWGASTQAGSDEAAPGQLAILTRRPAPGGMSLEGVPSVTRLKLEPLPPDDARLLVLGDAEQDLPADTRGELLARADGNPLLLQELVAAVRGGRPIDELPDTAEALMTARIDALPRTQRRLLREASILGVQVSHDLLIQLVGLERDQVLANLAALDDFLLPEGPGTVRFRHELLRSAAYNALSFKRRRELHARAASAIERRAGADLSAYAELLAIHYHAARTWRESWWWSRIAGKRAAQRSAPVEAAGFLAGALEAARHLRGLDPADRADVAEALGDAAELAGNYERAAEAFARARKLRAGDALAEASLCLKQGRAAESSQRLSAALRWFTRGLSSLDGAMNAGSTDSVRARLTLAQGATRLRAGRIRECLPFLDEAVELAERSGDRATLAHAYYLLDWAHTDLGHPEAEQFRELALPIYEELGDHMMQGRVLNNLGVNAYYECRWTEAVDFYERARAAAEKSGDSVKGRGMALSNLAEIRIDQGLIDDAEELLREALANWRAARHRVGIGTSLKSLGRIATRRGNFERAKDLLAQARHEFHAVGSESLVAEADAWEAERLVYAGEIGAALDLLDRLTTRTKRLEITPAISAAIERLAGQASLRGGDLEAGIEGLRRSADLARTAGADYEEALAALELARLAAEEDRGTDREEILTAERRARGTLERLGVVAPPDPAGRGPVSPAILA